MTAIPCWRRAAAQIAVQPGPSCRRAARWKRCSRAARPWDRCRWFPSIPKVSPRKGLNYFAPLAGAQGKPASGAVLQGKLEQSNVGAAESSVRLVAIMRQFEMLQKAMNLGNELNRRAIEEVARVTCLNSNVQENKMIRALYSAASGMTRAGIEHRQYRQQPGQRQHRRATSRGARSFRTLCIRRWYSPERNPATSTVVPSGPSAGTRNAHIVERDQSDAGRFHQTSNPLDMVIQGNGFFQVKQANGETAYTRAGSFQMDAIGQYRDFERRSDSASDHDSRGRAVDHHRHRWNGQLHAARPDRRADRRTDYTRDLPEPRRI